MAESVALTPRVAQQVLAKAQKDESKLEKWKAQAKATTEELTTGGLVIGGGCLGGALDAYFPEPNKKVLGLNPSETAALVLGVAGFSGVAGAKSDMLKDAAFGVAAYCMGFRVYGKVAAYKAQKAAGQPQQGAAGGAYTPEMYQAALNRARGIGG